jgi:hypothetical protein
MIETIYAADELIRLDRFISFHLIPLFSRAIQSISIPGLIHRFSFSGDLVDSITGDNSASLQGGAYLSSGKLIFPSTGYPYLKLPSNLWYAGDLFAATFEMWLTTSHAVAFETRFFQIGDDCKVDDCSYDTSLLVSSSSSTPYAFAALTYTLHDITNCGAFRATSNTPYSALNQSNVHVAIVLLSKLSMSLYVNGQLVATATGSINIGSGACGYLGKGFLPSLPNLKGIACCISFRLLT